MATKGKPTSGRGMQSGRSAGARPGGKSASDSGRPGTQYKDFGKANLPGPRSAPDSGKPRENMP